METHPEKHKNAHPTRLDPVVRPGCVGAWLCTSARMEGLARGRACWPPAGLGNRPTPVNGCPQRSVLRTTRLGSNASGHRSAVRAEDCGRSTKTRPLANVGPGVRLRPATGKSIVHRPGTRSRTGVHPGHLAILAEAHISRGRPTDPDRKSTRLNSSHANISYAVFCLKIQTVTR